MLEYGEIEQPRPRQLSHLLALRRREPVGADELDLLVHQPMHVDRDGLGNGADIDRAATAPNRLK